MDQSPASRIFAASPARFPTGRVARGDRVVAADSGRESTVASLLVGDRKVEAAEAGDAVTLTLADEIDIARGDMLSKPGQPAGGCRPVYGAHLLDER